MSSGSVPPDPKIEQLRVLAASLEAQRAILGATVDAMLAPLMAQIAALEGQAAPASAPSAAPPQPAPAHPIVEERKVVTVLMADISGFTAMSEKMDPEQVREVINACFDHIVPYIDKYEGTVEQFIGDEVVAFFGAPVVHENDAERAVRAALEMLSALGDFNSRRNTSLGMHIGINTGLVHAGAIGSRGREQYGITGDTINLASRLEHAATNGQIFMGHATYRQVRGLFEVQALEPLTLKGKSEPVRAYSVLREKPRSFRQEHRGIEGIHTRMVGRDAEFATLKDVYATIKEGGSPKLALIVGEAGLGKSRLLYELTTWIEQQSDQPLLLRGRAHAETTNVPFSIWRDVWADQFGLAEDDPPEVTRQMFEQGIAGLWTSPGSAVDSDPAEVGHIIGYLMGLDWPDSPYLGPLRANAQQAQGRAFHLIQQLFAKMGTVRPAIVVMEDLHWADSGTIDLLTFLLEADAELPVLVVGTARPDVFERFPRLQQPSGSQMVLRLQALTGESARTLLLEILGNPANLPSGLFDQIMERAEGNPYYLEEMVKMLIERGVAMRQPDGWRIFPERLAEGDLPDTLHGLLQARLDALALHEKSIAQRASVAGRTFWAGAVAATRPEGEVVPTLEQLAQRDMVYRDEPSQFAGELEFIFKHALLRDVAYETLPRRMRRVYHEQVADWLEANVGDDPVQAGQIGQHYELAEDRARAVAFYKKAARTAAQRFANHEAVDILSRALKLTDEPSEQFALLAERERALDWLGQRAGQREDLERMLAIARELASATLEAQTLNRQANLFARTGESELATSTAGRALQLARDAGRHDEEALALRNLGSVAFFNAEWPTALRYFEASLAAAINDSEFTLKADNLNAIGATHGHMGNYGEALRYMEQARQLARAGGDDFRRARILSNSGMIEATLGHYQTALVQKKEVLELQRQMGNRQSEAIALNNLGVEYHRLGLYAQAEEKFKECGKLFANLKSPWGLSNNLSNLALTYIEQENFAQALAALDEAQQLVWGKGVAQDVLLEIFNRRALAYLRTGDSGRAEEALAGAQSWLQSAKANPEKGQLALLWTYRAENELLKGDPMAGVAASERAVQIASGHRLGSDVLREVLLIRARVLAASGQSELARPALEQARQLVDESARGLDDTLRASFLHNVSINRMLLAEEI